MEREAAATAHGTRVRSGGAAATRAVDGWRASAAAAMATRMLLRSTVVAWLRRRLAVGFRTWRKAAARMVHSRLLVGDAMSCWLNLAVARGFNGWRAAAGAAIAAEEQRRYAAAIWLRHSAARALRTWAAPRPEEELLRRALCRWVLCSAAAALRHWRDVCEGAAHLRRCVLRWRHRNLGRAFAGWAAMPRRPLLPGWLVASLVESMALRGALRRWKHACGVAAARETARRAALTWVHRSLAVGWNAGWAAGERRATNLERVRRGVAR